MDRDAARGLCARLGGERGQVLALVAAGLGAFIMFVALAVDGGYAFWAKRSLQASADAAALAGAQALPSITDATNVAYEYSGKRAGGTPSAAGRNHQDPLDTSTTVTTECRIGGCTSGEADTVVVRETANVPTFFARLFGIGSYNVSARAVASRASVTTTSGGNNLAIYVHGLCEGGSGSFTGPVGLGANGKNTLVQGAIHINGNLKVGDSGFVSESTSTVWRPVHPDSPAQAGQTQGTCKWDGTSSLRIENYSGSPPARYCTLDCAPGNNEPTRGPWRDWATKGLYDDEPMVKSRVGTCTHGPGTPNPISGDETINGGSPGSPVVMSTPRFYCLGPSQKFTMNGAWVGPGGAHAKITVIAGKIEINATGSKIRPFNDAEPVLFWKSSTVDPLIINPSGAMDWIGYVINRFGGMNVNSGGVVSPREGLLEGEWININGENFTMLGRGPSSGGTTTTTINGPISLVE